MQRSRELPTRREFLASAAALGTLAATAPQGRAASPAARIPLGFDNFSIRAWDWKAPQLIEYAEKLQVDVLLLSDLEVYESLEPDYLQSLRARASQAQLELQAGTGSICPTSASYDPQKWGPAEDHVRLLVRTASRLGSSLARCYLGTRADREGDGGIERHIEATVKVLGAVRSEAEDAGVTIAVENHAGDMQAWELVELIEAAGATYVGAVMDAGNAVWTLEDPLQNLEILGPYAKSTGIRDSAVWETSQGAAAMWTNMGQGGVDWPAYLHRYQELCPHVPFVLEIISYRWASEAPYLEPAFWSRYPRARASEFARFVRLAKRGKEATLPPERPVGTPSPALEQAQQRFDLEQSLAYCREVLKLGLRR